MSTVLTRVDIHAGSYDFNSPQQAAVYAFLSEVIPLSDIEQTGLLYNPKGTDTGTFNQKTIYTGRFIPSDVSTVVSAITTLMQTATDVFYETSSITVLP